MFSAHHRRLVLIVIGGAALRIAVAFALPLPHRNTDTFAYLRQASVIRQGGWSDYFPNGYPLLIAAVGMVVPGRALDLWLLVLNAVLSTSIIILAWDVSRRLSGEGAALWTAALVACWPNLLNYTRYILTEIPSAFLLMLGAAALGRGFHGAGGAAAGLAAAMRTEFQLVWLLWPAGAAARAAPDRWRAARRFALAAALVTASFAGAALVINGTPTLGRNLATNFVTARTAEAGRLNFTREPASSDLRAAVALYLADARAEPAGFVRRRVNALWQLWGPWPTDDAGRRTLWRVLLGLRFPVILLVLWSIPRAARDPVGTYLLLALGAVTVVHTLLFSTPRFAAPVEPAAIVLAIEGILTLKRMAGAKGGSRTLTGCPTGS